MTKEACDKEAGSCPVPAPACRCGVAGVFAGFRQQQVVSRLWIAQPWVDWRLADWPWQSGGALTSIRRAPPLASRKVGLAMEIHVPSSISRRVSAFDGSWCFSGLVIVGFISPGLRAQAGCQEGVTSKAWNGRPCRRRRNAIVVGSSVQTRFVI